MLYQHNIKTLFSLIIILLLIILPFNINANSTNMFLNTSNSSYINITVEEAWNLLSNTSNGIQFPIDVRTLSEWEYERIDTPYPEFPRHIPKNDIVNESSYQDFIDIYDGEDVVLYCKSGGRSSFCASILVNRGFNGTVYNVLGGITDWKNYYPTKLGNTDPDIPTIINSPNVCNICQEYNFSVQTSDYNEDPVRFGWDFNGDEIVDKWTEFVISLNISTSSYSFDTTGTYQVSVLAQDIVGGMTDFTDPFTITINTAPNPPVIQGQINGKAGISYEYSIVSTDENDDEISYLINWDDGITEGWTRTKPSGEELIVSHEWDEKSEYTIKVKAKDIYDAESDWAELDVSMPKNQKQFEHRFAFFDVLIDLIQKIME